MLLGDGEAELLGEIVTKEEERAVAEVVQKKIEGNTKIQNHRWSGGHLVQLWCW